MIEERAQDLLAEVQSRIAVELQGTETAAVTDLLSVVPRSHDEEHFVVGRVLRLDGFVDRDRAVDVFLVPQAVHEHDGYLERLRGENLVHRLLAPERVVARMLEDLVPEADLSEPVPLPELTRRSR